jgi:hypothetical protein
MVCRQVTPLEGTQSFGRIEKLMFCSLWLQGIAVTLPSLQAEFGISETRVRYTTCALFRWPVSRCQRSGEWESDIMGRRLAFNLTLLDRRCLWDSSWSGSYL